ncbi:hypothetical protein [Hymenobacter fodinae]|uniref:Uncharacterized protein n=1 Tax=Hymenobacter fodinae TaxID=2510796 RepID=A0A4Z0PB73_9BACT|nr:hypothetical protein [Hymenobacter fodinae]TGE09834.1 hypothetical protein EU556_03125 [Hymenobacter fodinae]
MNLLTVKLLIAFTGVALTVGGWFFDAIKKPYTHLFNPHWLPHARYHSALWLFAITLACGASLGLLWGHYPGQDTGLAIWMAAFLPGLFYLSFFPSLLFRNTSSWDDGETPFMPIAPQLVVATVMLLVLGGALWLDMHLRVGA